MSLIIHHVIVHRIIEQDQQLKLLPRAEICSVSSEIEQLATELNRIYNSKPGKGVGGFLTEEELQEFAQQRTDAAKQHAEPSDPPAASDASSRTRRGSSLDVSRSMDWRRRRRQRQRDVRG